MRSRAGLGLAVWIVALAAVAGAAAATEYRFKLHHFLTTNADSHARMLVPWSERLAKASGGRIRIDIYPSMTLGGKPAQLPRQVRDGVVDMAWILNGYAAGSFPRTEVFELPGIHRGSSAAVNLAMHAMLEADTAADFEGIVPLFQHVHGGNALNMARDILREPADFKGRKIRIPTRTGAWILEAFGASPVKTSVGEIPVALARRVIDGALIPFQVIPPLKIQAQAKVHIEGPAGQRFGTSTFQVAMNKKRWDALPDDIKRIFREQSGVAWHRELGARWDSWEAKGLAVAMKAGNRHVRLTAAEWTAFELAMTPVVTRWIAEMRDKGIDGAALYDKARGLVAAHMAR